MPSTWRNSCLVVLALVAGPVSARAQGTAVPARTPGPAPAPGAPQASALPATVTLEQALQLLAERSPRTLADRAAVEVAAADRITARTLPNPSVSYGGVHLMSGLSTGATTQHQAIVEQPLLIFHQRQARTDAANLNVRATQATVADTLAQRRLAVRQAFATLLSRQEQLAVTRQSVADLEEVENVVRVRAQAGESRQYDLLRIQAETGTLRVQLMNAETDVEDAARELAALIGLPDWSPRASGTLEAGNVPTDPEALWTIAQQQRPSIVAVREQAAAARGGLALARRERLPVPAVSGGTQYTQNVNGTSAFFGFSLPLPVFDKGQGPIAKAAAQIEQQQLRLTAELAESRAEVERAATILSRRREALARLEGEVVQRMPVLRRMAEDAYREGSGDILELLDAMRAIKDIQITHVQQLESTKLAEELVVSVSGLDAPALPVQ